MHKYLTILFTSILFMMSTTHTYSAAQVTHRVAQFSNKQVTVWKTTLFPGSSQTLKMHRHDKDRVLVAFNNGTLKIKNDKGSVHYLNLEKNKAYYLKKDNKLELHSDENITHHPIHVLVIELNS